MTKNPETIINITHLEEVIAIIIRENHQVNDLEFFTEDQDPLQVGMHNKKKGVTLTPHIHLSNTKVVSEIQEVLYIIEGKLKVTYYTIEGETISTFILGKGDTLIHRRGGHGFEMLEDTKIIEVKQGPYPGTQHAKIYLKGSHDENTG